MNNFQAAGSIASVIIATAALSYTIWKDRSSHHGRPRIFSTTLSDGTEICCVNTHLYPIRIEAVDILVKHRRPWRRATVQVAVSGRKPPFLLKPKDQASMLIPAEAYGTRRSVVVVVSTGQATRFGSPRSRRHVVADLPRA